MSTLSEKKVGNSLSSIMLLHTMISLFLMSQVTRACDPTLATAVLHPVITNSVVSIPFATGGYPAVSVSNALTVDSLTLQCADSSSVARTTTDVNLFWR